jgi:hypothetical protein
LTLFSSFFAFIIAFQLQFPFYCVFPPFSFIFYTFSCSLFRFIAQLTSADILHLNIQYPICCTSLRISGSNLSHKPGPETALLGSSSRLLLPLPPSQNQVLPLPKKPLRPLPRTQQQHKLLPPEPVPVEDTPVHPSCSSSPVTDQQSVENGESVSPSIAVTNFEAEVPSS